MNMLEFMDSYRTEEQCRKNLFNSRWPNGFVCPKCGHVEYFDIKFRNLYQCKNCNHQVSDTVGTIMDKTRTPLRKWFLAIYLMAEDKRGLSALSFKSKISVSYQTAWTMCQKIRHAMGEREDNYSLNGIIEMEEAVFGAPTEDKRGRGTDKTAVFVSGSLSKDGKPEFAKMKVVETDVGESVDSENVKNFADKAIAKGSEIHTDGLNIYNTLSENGYTLIQKNYDPKNEPKHLH